jgi:hypothetical protein
MSAKATPTVLPRSPMPRAPEVGRGAVIGASAISPNSSGKSADHQQRDPRHRGARMRARTGVAFAIPSAAFTASDPRSSDATSPSCRQGGERPSTGKVTSPDASPDEALRQSDGPEQFALR